MDINGWYDDPTDEHNLKSSSLTSDVSISNVTFSAREIKRNERMVVSEVVVVV